MPKEFELMRANVIQMYHLETPGISQALGYAWASRVYPLLHSEKPAVRKFAGDFDFTDEDAEIVSDALWTALDNGSALTYYELERQVPNGHARRSLLSSFLRYFTAYWQDHDPGERTDQLLEALLRPGHAPTEVYGWIDSGIEDVEISL